MEEKAQDAQCCIKRKASPTGSPDDGNLESKIDSGKTAACRNQRHHGHRSVKQRRSGCFGGCTGSARDSRANRQGSQWRRSSGDRKSTRLNSSHLGISYAVFCLKKLKLELEIVTDL